LSACYNVAGEARVRKTGWIAVSLLLVAVARAEDKPADWSTKVQIGVGGKHAAGDWSSYRWECERNERRIAGSTTFGIASVGTDGAATLQVADVPAGEKVERETLALEGPSVPLDLVRYVLRMGTKTPFPFAVQTLTTGEDKVTLAERTFDCTRVAIVAESERDPGKADFVLSLEAWFAPDVKGARLVKMTATMLKKGVLRGTIKVELAGTGAGEGKPTFGERLETKGDKSSPLR
jgi:hypothetical protein